MFTEAIMREAAGRRCLGRNTLEISGAPPGAGKKNPGAKAGMGVVLEGAERYSQGTDRVTPAEAMYFLQPTALAGRS